MSQPRALDLFCGAGGATKGLQRAGFHVTGVDIKPQSRYCGDAFHQADAMAFPLDGFDFIWASPPCQAFCSMKSMPNAKEHADLVDPIRRRLKKSGAEWVIENVPGAPLARGSVLLCGTMFGLGVGDAELRRHRWFESSFAMLTPSCSHGARSRSRVIGVYGGHGRDRRRIRPATVGVYGGAGGKSVRDGTQQFSTAERREAMGIDWMTGAELSQAIPPAYSEYIGRAILSTAPFAPAAGMGGA